MGDELRLKAHALIAQGDLPVDRRTRTFGGIGSGAFCCVVCEQWIGRGSPEIELDWQPVRPSVVPMVMHPACHQSWLQASRELRPAPMPVSATV